MLHDDCGTTDKPTKKPTDKGRGNARKRARKATGRGVLPADVAVHARGGAHIRARNAQARNARRATHTHKHALTAQARRKHVARTDKAQHVAKPPTRGQIRVLCSKSINDATARPPLKIRALQAAKRQTGQHARATRAKGRQAAEKARQAVKGGARCTTRRRLNANTPPNGAQGGKKRRRRQSR